MLGRKALEMPFGFLVGIYDSKTLKSKSKRRTGEEEDDDDDEDGGDDDDDDERDEREGER